MCARVGEYLHQEAPMPKMTWNSHTNNGTVYVSGSATNLYGAGSKTSANFSDSSQAVRVTIYIREEDWEHRHALVAEGREWYAAAREVALM
jgi:hypothetical protein